MHIDGISSYFSTNLHPIFLWSASTYVAGLLAILVFHNRYAYTCIIIYLPQKRYSKQLGYYLMYVQHFKRCIYNTLSTWTVGVSGQGDKYFSYQLVDNLDLPGDFFDPPTHWEISTIILDFA